MNTKSSSRTKLLLLSLVIMLLTFACSFGASTNTPEKESSPEPTTAPVTNDPKQTAPTAVSPASVDLPVLGDVQTIEDGGFRFRMVPDYTLLVQGGMVSLTAPGADPDVGPVLQMMGWKNESERTNQQLYEQLVSDTPMTVSPASPIEVAGVPGLAAEITGDNNGKPMQGKVAMVMVTPQQQFILMLGAPQAEWTSLSPLFEAVLASVEFVELVTAAPVSGLTSGWYAYVNSNVVRDLVIYDNVAYTATLGGMLAWNLQSGSAVQHTPLQGMGHVSATAITVCQIPETRIIVGTLNGLSLYDPASGLWEQRELTPPDSQVASNKITRLFCDQANQRLLIGYSGLGVLDLKTGEFQRFTKQDGLAWEAITDISVAGQDIWLATGYKGVARIANGKVTSYTVETGMPDERAHAVAYANDGTLWVGAGSGIMSFKAGKWTMYGSDTPARLSDINEIEISADGKIWAATAPLGTGRLCQFNPNSGACEIEYKDAENQAIMALALGENDDPLYTTSKGLYLFDGSTAAAFKHEDKLVSNFVDSFASAPDGQLWVGTDGGIQTLDPNDPSGAWTTFIKSQTTGLGGNWASGLAAAADGVVWAAVINGDASRYENGSWTTLKDLYSFNVVTVDADNKAWFGDDGKGIIVLNPDGSPAMTFTAADGLPSDRVSALITDSDGTVWIGTESGLASYAQGTLSVVFGSDDKRLPNRYIRDLALAPDGALIIGTFTGVARLAGDEVTILIDFLKDGYPQARLTTLAAAADGRIWAGTDKGLLYADNNGQWTMLTTQDGLLTNYISALLVDPYGTTWVGGGGSNFDGGGILHMVP